MTPSSLPGRITVETKREFRHRTTNSIMVQQKLWFSKKGVSSRLILNS